MKSQTIRSRRLSLALALVPMAFGGLAGCGADEMPTTSETEEAVIGGPVTGACSVRGADGTMGRNSGEVLSSPTSYGTSGCPKSWIWDTTPPSTNGDELLTLQWTDRWARNQSQCAGGKLQLDLMSRGPGELVFRGEGTYEMPLTWNASKQRCDYGYINVGHATANPGPVVENWLVAGFREGEPSTRSWLQEIRSFNGRTLRFVARALTPRGTTQSISLMAQAFAGH